ncbi:MAG: ABC transporter permease [Gammaproteobacteria bacterium]|nr:ABC transporter permease [Gammaproteobacteria bacterium]
MRSYFLPFEHANLLLQLSRREIQQRFRGSWLGVGWTVLTPLAMLLVYTFVFRTVLGARWPGAPDSDTEFALRVFSGLLVFSLFSDVVARAPNLVVEQPNLVKKVIFPLEILSWVSTICAVFNACVSMLVLVAAAALAHGGVSCHILALPLVLAALVPMLLGWSWLLASLGVYVRDLSHVVGLILTPLLFLSPVFYPLSALSRPDADHRPLQSVDCDHRRCADHSVGCPVAGIHGAIPLFPDSRNPRRHRRGVL